MWSFSVFAVLLAQGAQEGAATSSIWESPVFLGIVSAVLAPSIAFVTWILSRKHQEDIDDTASISDAVGAITDANVNIAAVVTSLIAPMQAELKRQAEVESRQAEELEIMRLELSALQIRFTSIIRYVNILRRQVSDAGLEPHPIPDDLDLSGFNFD